MKTENVDIIIVEDNLNEAELTIRALKKNNTGSSFIHLKDGQEAVDYIFCEGSYETRQKEDLPKLILLDLKMPKLNGIEVLRRIKSDPDYKKIPVVLLTSSQEDRDIQESYNLGVNSYIVKPVDFDEFETAVSCVGDYWVRINQTPFL